MSEVATKTEQTDGLYTPGIVVAGFVASVATFVIIIALQALYLSLEKTQQREAAQNAINTSESLMAEQSSRLNQYGWIDREKNIVSIPIDRAIVLTAAELNAAGREKSNSGNPSTSIRNAPSFPLSDEVKK
ncbi:MAG: hypothetical protein AB8G99_00620 [Planctomycetaceae bacterium]